MSTKHLACLFKVSRRPFSLHKLSTEHELLQKTCRNFAEKELKPIASQLDRESKFPAPQIQKMADLGLMGLCASQAFGGAGQNTLGLCLAIEEISRCCGGTGSLFSIHNCLYVDLLDKIANSKQKEQFLTPFTKGFIGCFALSEPDAGSDVANISTKATLQEDHYVLTGTKSWVTGGPVGKAAIIFATIDKSKKHRGIQAFLVPIPSPGLSLGTPEDKLGIRASPTCTLHLDNVKIPRENLLEADGFKLAMMQLDKARIGIASQALGIAQAAFELATEYAQQRKAFGKPLIEMQAVKLRLADMAIKLEGARLLVWRAAVCHDEPQRSSKESSICKVAASEAATFITHSTIQILGGMGYVKEMPAERHYRDARITEIYAGVNDIQRLVIADLIAKK